ncbi:mitochondrial ornithine transporter 1-like [Saccoglossus kowalevskii]|uniref:Mitochondrial ornithine transporter 1-like n=1 Tax=Saccoglossus kowalevskii TaxID=10224 RepID=A0ABM0GNH3_SACKO|nr:PREDICTED: mitochondrial ornithine transporter 1-like [Saccoglossus kowalevskii]
MTITEAPGGLVEGFVHPHSPAPVHPIWQSFAEFTAGAVGGVACVITGQPFDTIKVKMQTFPSLYTSSIQCCRVSIKNEQFIGLYRGTVPALAANILENSILFLCYGLCKKAVCQVMGHPHEDHLTALENATAGAGAGFFSSLGLCPTELVKCRMQAMHEVIASEGKKTTGRFSTWSVTKALIRQDGFHGLFQGLTSTWAREVPGYFFFFGGYEISRSILIPKGNPNAEISPLRLMICGGFAGACLWSAMYPVDVVKSRIQVQSMVGKVQGFMPTLKTIIRTEGIGALYNGVVPCVLRSFPANGALFVAYEWTRKHLILIQPSNFIYSF